MAGGRGYSWNYSLGLALSSEWEVILLGSDTDTFPCVGGEKDTHLRLLGSLFLSTGKKVVGTMGDP